MTSGHVRAREDESGVASGLAGLHHARRRLRVVSVIYVPDISSTDSMPKPVKEVISRKLETNPCE